MNQEKLTLSVALVTRNRPESLERTLQSLRAQSVQPYEVIVSDDSDEVQSSIVQALAEKHDCIYIRGPQRGLYANRNHVALHCQGTHIRTMDDDHEFPIDHMNKCVAAMVHDPNSVWVIGECPPSQLLAPQSPIPLPCPGQLHARGFSVHPDNPQQCWAISDGASIYPRGIFDQRIYYSEAFKFGAAYLEFGDRLFWLGYRIRHLETTYVIHHYDVTTRSFLSDEIDSSSQYFAMLCHSFIYQPSVKNKILSTLEITKQIMLQGSRKKKCFKIAIKEFKQHREVVLKLHHNATDLPSSRE